MALLIDISMNIYGIPTSQLYTRIKYTHEAGGSDIKIDLHPYFNKSAYSDKEAIRLRLENPSFPRLIDESYNRDVDGVDILGHVHNVAIDKLSTDVIQTKTVIDPSTGEVVYIQDPVLDPSTGEQVTDPSTGEPLWQDGDPSTYEAVAIPKFCELEDITVVDVSLA